MYNSVNSSFNACVHGSTNGTNGIPMSFKVQSTNGTIGNTIDTNGNANGTIGSPNGTICTISKPMVPLTTNGTIVVPLVPLGEPRTDLI